MLDLFQRKSRVEGGTVAVSFPNQGSRPVWNGCGSANLVG